MRALIQRVSFASVTVNAVCVSEINQGLLIFLGIEDEDKPEDMDWLIKKIVGLRIFNDTHGIMNLSVKEIAGELLVVSQFTLQASCRKGNRPSYSKAAKPQKALPLYQAFLERLGQEVDTKVKAGVFGAHMLVNLENDGPVTFSLDSKIKE